MRRINILICTFLLALIFCMKASAKEYGVGRITNNERPNLDIKQIIDNNGYKIGKDDSRIYLTFDCGYENGYTNSILDILKENDVHACFFITGHYLKTNIDIVNKMIDKGHIVANHTLNHNSFAKESVDGMMKDIIGLEKLYTSTLGLEMLKIVRPPKGEYSVKALSTLNNEGYKTIFWSLCYVDWDKGKFYGNNYSLKNVESKIHNCAIILMHTVSKDNMLDLPKIIDFLNPKYEFSSVLDL